MLVYWFVGAILAQSRASVKIESIVLWPDAHDSATRFSSDKGSLRDIHDVHETGQIELVISADGKPAEFEHVGLLFSDKPAKSSTVLGAHPSIHIPLKSTKDSAKVFKAVFDFSSMRTVNPEGGLLDLAALIVPANGTDPVRKELGKIRLGKSPSRGESKRIIPELSSFVPEKVIKHMFKPEPSRASPFYSLIFTGLALTVPILVLLWGLFKTGINAKSLVGVPRLAFTGLMCAFMGLMAAFFAFLNLVQPVAIFLLLLGPLVIVGNRVLCQVRATGDIRDV